MNLFFPNIEELSTDERNYLAKRVGIETEDYKVIDCNFIISLDKSSLTKATYLSDIYNVPILSYIDWINPWDVFLEDETSWGFFNKIEYKDKIKSLQQSVHELRLFSKVELPVASTNYTKNIIQSVLSDDIQCTLLKRGISYEKTYGIVSAEHGTKFITIYSDLTNIEKTYHILRALSMINDELNLPIILLTDKMDMVLNTVAEALGVPVKFMSTKNKNSILNNSKIVISLTNKNNISEALFFKNKVITYRTPYIEEYFGDAVVYANDNSILDLAKTIETELNKEYSYEPHNIPTMEEFLNGILRLCKNFKNKKHTWCETDG